MNIQKNISLKPYNTFGIDVRAKHYTSVQSLEQLSLSLKNKDYPQKFVLSGGSNMLLTKDIDALVLHINIKGIKVIQESPEFVHLEVAAGENWHEVVKYCLDRNYGGIENLSLIPGNSGTAPIQNIGAYGVELKDVLISCNAMNIQNQQLVKFSAEECQFGYRESVFKNKLKGKFIITSIVMKLTKLYHHKLVREYGAINAELAKNNIQDPTIKDISDAVISIRSEKLPDPKLIGNSGSFFKNPIISRTRYERLKNQFFDMPAYDVSDEIVKIPAGWLIEKAGFKGKSFGEYGVHKKQALVLVNYGNADGKDILNLAKIIKNTIKVIFDIEIETEVNIF